VITIIIYSYFSRQQKSGNVKSPVFFFHCDLDLNKKSNFLQQRVCKTDTMLQTKMLTITYFFFSRIWQISGWNNSRIVPMRGTNTNNSSKLPFLSSEPAHFWPVVTEHTNSKKIQFNCGHAFKFNNSLWTCIVTVTTATSSCQCSDFSLRSQLGLISFQSLSRNTLESCIMLEVIFLRLKIMILFTYTHYFFSGWW